jgi:predicted Zn-ribbon and HTH transcriptional regulator
MMEQPSSLLTLINNYGKKADRLTEELSILKVVIKKVQDYLVLMAPEWETCEHEYDDLPQMVRRCLKCNAKIDEVEILMLCREITSRGKL